MTHAQFAKIIRNLTTRQKILTMKRINAPMIKDHLIEDLIPHRESDIQTDINYHSSMSRHVGTVPLRRLSKQPYHYSDTYKHILRRSDSITKGQIRSAVDNDTTMLTVEETDNETFIAKTLRRVNATVNFA